jgi:hypothetical protein
MNTEVLSADISAGDEYLGSIDFVFDLSDGRIVGLSVGGIRLDGDTAIAIHEEIIARSRQEGRAH